MWTVHLRWTLTGQRALGICLSLSPQGLVYKSACLFSVAAGTTTEALMVETNYHYQLKSPFLTDVIQTCNYSIIDGGQYPQSESNVPEGR